MPDVLDVRDVRRSASGRRARDWSLLEVVIAIGIVAILIGLILPALGAAREKSRATPSSANLATIARLLAHYAGQSDDLFPIGRPATIYPASMVPGSVSESFSVVWEFDRAWPLVMRPIVPLEESFPALFSPLVSPPGPASDVSISTSYPLAHSVMARPGLWRPAALPDPALLTTMRSADVAHPGQKVVSWDSHAAYLVRPRFSDRYPPRIGNPRPMLFGDGQSILLPFDGAASPVPNIMNDDPGDRQAPLHNTPLGVLGRDF